MATFHVQLYREDNEGRIRPDGAEEITEADTPEEAAALVSGERLSLEPGGSYAAKVWTIVDYAAMSFDFFRARSRP